MPVSTSKPIEYDYQVILREIAGGEFQKLQKEVERLKEELAELKTTKKVLVSEETIIEDWDNEYDKRWDTV